MPRGYFGQILPGIFKPAHRRLGLLRNNVLATLDLDLSLVEFLLPQQGAAKLDTADTLVDVTRRQRLRVHIQRFAKAGFGAEPTLRAASRRWPGSTWRSQ